MSIDSLSHKKLQKISIKKGLLVPLSVTNNIKLQSQKKSAGDHTSPRNISILLSFAENTRIQISEAEYIAQETLLGVKHMIVLQTAL